MAGAGQVERAAIVELVQGNRSVVLGLVGCRSRGNLQVVDDLLKVQLHAARLGWRVRVSVCRPEVLELLDLLGVRDRLEWAARLTPR